MKNYTTSELAHLIDELRFKGYLNENDEILICDNSVKDLLNDSTKVYTTPFKQKAKKRFISIRSKVSIAHFIVNLLKYVNNLVIN